MGVVLCHGPMGGPTGVGNAQVCGMPCRGGCEFCHPANRSHPRESCAVEKRKASRIVSAVFQLTKTLDEKGRDVLGCKRTDDATHLFIFSDCEGVRLTL